MYVVADPDQDCHDFVFFTFSRWRKVPNCCIGILMD